MTVEKLAIEGVLLVKPRIFEDDRGYFFESFNQKTFQSFVGTDVEFCQDNESKSQKNVLRGMHFQAPPFDQGKLVRVIKGAVLDVAVDIRKNSETYGQYVSVELTEENKQMLWIPPGFAHGFLTLKDDTIFSYKCTNFYNKESEGSLSWDDETVNIDWELKEEPILSEKDRNSPTFANFYSPF